MGDQATTRKRESWREPPSGQLLPDSMTEGPRDPRSGAPLAEKPRLMELPTAVAAREKRDLQRWRDWSARAAQTKTQIACQVRWRDESEPLWSVRLSGYNAAEDCWVNCGEQPGLVLRAVNEHTARARYCEVMGIIRCDVTIEVRLYRDGGAP